MRHFLLRFTRAQRGLAFIEFALVAPFVLLVLWGGIELTRFMLIVQKVDKAAYAIADLTAQENPTTSTTSGITVSEMNTNVFPQFIRLMAPYNAVADGSIIVSSIRRERDVTRVKWQIATSGGYSDAFTVSAVTGLTPAAVNSQGAGLKDRATSFTGEAAANIADMLGYENMIVSEVFYRYRPILAGVLSNGQLPFQLGETTLVRRIYTRPRNGNLICLPPTFTYDECTARTPVPLLGCTTVTGAGSCLDDCTKCRANGREYCTVQGSTHNYMRCTNGVAVNQNLPTGCTGIGTVSCDN